jgi:broad specificity phosphatase PhoE
MIIKLVRHGESEANVADPSRPPAADYLVPLTPRGVEQARQAGRTLGSEFLKDA